MSVAWLLAGVLSGTSAASSRSLEAIPTTDGAILGLHHLPGSGAPILLVHGLSSNHRSFDLGGRGLAHDLQAAGYDVWMLDLRGREQSAPPQRRPTWTLDDYGRYDVAAAVDFIRETTHWEHVAYVGHSMGGMVLAIYHHWHGDGALGPAIVLGSPLRFDHPDPLIAASSRAMRRRRLVRRVPSAAAARTASLLPATPRVDAMLFDAAGTSKRTRRQMYRAIVSTMTEGELRHIGQLTCAGRLQSADQTIDYVDSLDDWDTPLLVVAGRSDRIATTDRVVAWIDATQSRDETWWVAGTAHGYPHEFGHLDLILADSVSQTLHADILEWLAARPW